MFQLLSATPPIFYAVHWMDEELRFMQCLDPLFEALRNDRAYFLYTWWWHIDDPKRVDFVRHFEKRHRKRYPSHQFIHLCNAISQFEIFTEKGLRAIFCNQNCLLDERVFTPQSTAERTIDAVYTGRCVPHKRHHLASLIKSLGLIYTFDKGVDRLDLIDATRNLLPHAYLFNHEQSDEYQSLTPAQINNCLNRCRVGLCLSPVEGAMYASMEYLLAGLPIVSTKSQGGRDIFFDDAYVSVVDDHPEAVSEAVERIIRRNLSPDFIREKTLEKLMPHRQALISLVQEIYDAEGVDRDFASEWPLVFRNKLYAHQRYQDAIDRIEAARRR